MNAIPRQTSFQIDWVINYVEVNSRPSPTNDYCRLRITNSEIQIDPAGIVLSIQKSTDEGIELQCGSDKYFGTLTQRGNELVVKLVRSNSSDNVMIVAKRIVSEFDPSVSFKRASFSRISENAAHSVNAPSSFF